MLLKSISSFFFFFSFSRISYNLGIFFKESGEFLVYFDTLLFLVYVDNKFYIDENLVDFTCDVDGTNYNQYYRDNNIILLHFHIKMKR